VQRLHRRRGPQANRPLRVTLPESSPHLCIVHKTWGTRRNQHVWRILGSAEACENNTTGNIRKLSRSSPLQTWHKERRTDALRELLSIFPQVSCVWTDVSEDCEKWGTFTGLLCRVWEMLLVICQTIDIHACKFHPGESGVAPRAPGVEALYMAHAAVSTWRHARCDGRFVCARWTLRAYVFPSAARSCSVNAAFACRGEDWRWQMGLKPMRGVILPRTHRLSYNLSIWEVT